MSDSDADSATRAGSWGPGAPQGGWTQPPPPPTGGGYQPPPGGSWGPPPGGQWPPHQAPPTGGSGPRRGAGWAIVAVVLAGLVVLGGVGIGWGLATAGVIRSVVASRTPIHTVPQIGTSTAGSQGARPLDPQTIANRVGAATVDINTVLASLGGQSGQAAGTGMILTSTGEVLTNHHVVQQATSIKVTIQGRSGSYNAHVEGVDPSADVALIQVEGVSGLPTVTLADSSTLSVGQQVVALGNALGQGGAPSVTQGTITALDQSITAGSDNGTSEQLTGLIQSDAQISPGDSGGPLVNTAGQVVGMITAGETQGFRQTTSNVGYAIPSNQAVEIVNEIRSGSSSPDIIIGQAGYLGVSVQDLTPRLAARLGLNVSSGVLVTGVASGSPAERIGLAQDAVITAVDGKQIGSASQLGPAIQSHKPGQTIRVTWVDQSGTHTASATLISGPVA